MFGMQESWQGCDQSMRLFIQLVLITRQNLPSLQLKWLLLWWCMDVRCFLFILQSLYLVGQRQGTELRGPHRGRYCCPYRCLLHCTGRGAQREAMCCMGYVYWWEEKKSWRFYYAHWCFSFHREQWWAKDAAVSAGEIPTATGLLFMKKLFSWFWQPTVVYKSPI